MNNNYKTSIKGFALASIVGLLLSCGGSDGDGDADGERLVIVASTFLGSGVGIDSYIIDVISEV